MKERLPFASGAEKDVYKHLVHHDKLVKEYRNESQEASMIKARFYFAKVLRVLFPKNFPSMSIAGTGQKKIDQRPHVVVEKVDLDNRHAEIQRLYDADFSRTGSRRLGQLMKEVDEDPRVRMFDSQLDFFGVYFDKTFRNYAISKDGHVLYLDTIDPWSEVYIPQSGKTTLKLAFDPEKISEGIDLIKDPVAQTQVRAYLDKVLLLFEAAQSVDL
ncbi:MAG: hypothetical protein WAT81_05280 [Candidatus Moraniibacteriota bacterium]